MRFQDRVAIVTGAGQGIGRACALMAARGGAKVALAERNDETGNAVLAELAARGGEGMFLPVDVSDSKSVRDAVARILERWGRIDILVNNAGFDRPSGIYKIREEDWDAVLGVHLRGSLLLIRETIPVMRRQGYGRIVNISSVYGKIGAAGELAYCTAKAGLIGLTKSVAKEAGKHGITVNAVLPGLTDTPTIRSVMAEKYKDEIISRTPLGRMGKPEEIASAVLFLASDEASFITGAALEVSGGWEM